MKKILTFLLIIFGLGLSAFIGFVGFNYFRPQKAGILVETNPSALVFINGLQVGKTPYEATQTVGEISLKLVPEATGKILVPYETRVFLGAGIKTVVKRDFGETESLSSGEIISFEKTTKKEVGLAIVSSPDSAQIMVDGTVRGFAPYKTTSLTLGEHQIIVSAPSYLPRTLNVKTLLGYKLVATVKLAPDLTNFPPATPTPEPSLTPPPKVTIQISQTPNGFLRVRETPDTNAKELGRVTPGEKFEVIETDSKTGWYKIEHLAGQFGWVSASYCQVVND